MKLRKFTRKQFKTIKWKCCLESGECCRTNWIISTTHLSSELYTGCPTKYMKIERTFLVLIAFKYLRVYPNKVSRIKSNFFRTCFLGIFLSWDSYQSFRSYLHTLEVLGWGGGKKMIIDIYIYVFRYCIGYMFSNNICHILKNMVLYLQSAILGLGFKYI